MSVLSTYKQACKAALAAHCSFAAYFEPGNRHTHFICDDHSNSKPISDEVFFAAPWATPFSQAEIIVSRMSAEQAETLRPSATPPFAHALKPWRKSTDPTLYREQVTKLAEYLRLNGGKTVISTVLCTPTAEADIVELADRVFDRLPSDTHRCLLFTPAFGAWIIASPELLLSVHKDTQTVKTIALAGTRRAGTSGDWDKKNIDEQQMVATFVAETLSLHAKNIKIDGPHTRDAGRVEHLETIFSATLNETDEVSALLEGLNPTPAVCGTPRKAALRIIEQAEEHPRRLYGGYFGISDSKRIVAAVTLRCAQISDTDACIYAGGGITGASHADDEWTETRLKGKALLELITQPSKSL